MADDLSGKQAIAAATSTNDTDVNSVNDGPGGTGRYVGGNDAEVFEKRLQFLTPQNPHPLTDHQKIWNTSRRPIRLRQIWRKSVDGGFWANG